MAINLRRIVLGAAARLNIAIVWIEPHESVPPHAVSAARLVVIHRDLDNLEHALSALHEIGHIPIGPCPGHPAHNPAYGPPLAGHDGPRPLVRRRCVECERAAWQWVVYVLGPWWTPAMEAHRRRCLSTYERSPFDRPLPQPAGANASVAIVR